MEWVPKIQFLGTRNQLKTQFKANQTMLFLIFCQIFGIFDDFSKFNSAFGMLYFGNSSKMAKFWQKMMKNLVRLAFTHFFIVLQIPNIRVSGTCSTTNILKAQKMFKLKILTVSFFSKYTPKFNFF